MMEAVRTSVPFITLSTGLVQSADWLGHTVGWLCWLLLASVGQQVGWVDLWIGWVSQWIPSVSQWIGLFFQWVCWVR
jgi:hypothetical protein